MEKENVSTRGEETAFDKFNALIDHNLGNSAYAIKNFCEDLGVSRSQLFRLVKENAGTSPSLYIRQRRLQHGRELLEGAGYRIAEVSDRVGFSSPQNFTKYFRQEFGQSPTEFRKSQPNAAEDVDQDDPDADDVSSPTGYPARVYSRYRPLIWAIGALLLSVGGYFVFFRDASTGTPASGDFSNSVAILPFRSQGDARVATLADGLTGQVHASLAGVENLKVISRTSSELFKNSRKKVPQIAAELDVAYILVGTVAKVAEKTRVNIELIVAAEDRTLWAENFEGQDQELLAFMNTVARRVTRQLDQY